jgi:catechol 2,3-dioxygenase-like lactoylglutathione lyase family enzyme
MDLLHRVVKWHPGCVEQRLSLVTLGVADVGRAVGFYEALGWKPDNDWRKQGVAFFQCGGIAVALWSRDELGDDSTVDDPGGWGGVTVAYNVRSPAEVDAVLAEAEAAGATIGRPGTETFWGGYSGVFVDPDGHPWEVAHNPHWTINEDGTVTI